MHECMQVGWHPPRGNVHWVCAHTNAHALVTGTITWRTKRLNLHADARLGQCHVASAVAPDGIVPRGSSRGTLNATPLVLLSQPCHRGGVAPLVVGMSRTLVGVSLALHLVLLPPVS
eukprot:m.193744 g.193744  ORF g.193744 m.193744 type:complete len:117 (-) comp18641_c0_seq3:353-703(-)